MLFSEDQQKAHLKRMMCCSVEARKENRIIYNYSRKKRKLTLHTLSIVERFHPIFSLISCAFSDILAQCNVKLVRWCHFESLRLRSVGTLPGFFRLGGWT